MTDRMLYWCSVTLRRSPSTPSVDSVHAGRSLGSSALVDARLGGPAARSGVVCDYGRWPLGLVGGVKSAVITWGTVEDVTWRRPRRRCWRWRWVMWLNALTGTDYHWLAAARRLLSGGRAEVMKDRLASLRVLTTPRSVVIQRTKGQQRLSSAIYIPVF